jgi:uncharacterized protein YeaO (DUF488 family)
MDNTPFVGSLPFRQWRKPVVGLQNPGSISMITDNQSVKKGRDNPKGFCCQTREGCAAALPCQGDRPALWLLRPSRDAGSGRDSFEGGFPMIRLKRIYDPPEETDGFRILVDRLWPRGVKKEKASIDHWARELAPSDELRKRFHRDRDFDRFREAYFRELNDPEKTKAWRLILERAAGRPITFLYASRNRAQNNAMVLREWAEAQTARGTGSSRN